MGYDEKEEDVGFFTVDDTGDGQYDWNADLYKEKQIVFAADLEAMSNYELWERKGKFSEHDYDITNKGDDESIGSALIIPGIPVLGCVELKCRNVLSTTFPTTVVDTEKMNKLLSRNTFSKLPVFICWRFTDTDMYYQVDYKHKFTITQSRNTHCSKDNKWEYKQVSHIPMDLLQQCHPLMFGKEG